MMRTILLVGGLVAALLLNVATVTSGAVASVVSGVVEAITGMPSVMTRLEREVGTTKGKVAALETEIRKKDNRVKALEGEITTRNNKVKALEAQVDSLKPKKVTYRGQQKFLGEAVADTSQRVAKRTAVGATRNVAATFGEAVPVVGIAVVVAATAWEMKDACDTMKDLHELDVAIDPAKATAKGVSEVCGLEVPSREELWAKVKASPGKAWAKAKEAIPDLR